MKAAVATSLVAAFAGMAMAYPQSSPSVSPSPPSVSPSSSSSSEQAKFSPAEPGTECTKHSDCGGCGPNPVQLLQDARGDSSTPMDCSVCELSWDPMSNSNACAIYTYEGAELEAVR